ncbi:hypothetical protein JX266_010122 [Neoarthrinium moseri]|nr:hypothetical protein JX266_010122 [Neoarthrinium moseri]
MKNSLALLTLAAGLSQVTATGFGFHNAPSFSCPDNTDNKCTDKQSKGFDFGDLNLGGFSNYGGFNWAGFSCESGFGKRDGLQRRTVNSKCITGKASSSKQSSPSFGCDTKSGVDKTSVKEFHVYPEFDCDLEFHYDMPDGSSCKHRSPCSSKGTIVKNSQCGGAKNVTIVYPSQPSKPKPTCSFAVPSISFGCSTASSTKTVSTVSSTSTAKVSTTSSSAVQTTSSYPAGSPSTVSATTSGKASTSTSAVVTSSAPSSTYAVSTSKVESSSSKVESSSTKVESSTTKAESTTVASSTKVESTTEATTITSVTSYMTTSTILSTVVSTVTSCGPSVPNCPASSTALTTLTVSVGTTICPVTETFTTVTKPTGVPTEKPSTEKPTEQPSTVVTSSATAPVASSSTSPAGPVETLPCPQVVPSCLNTWMFSVGCSSNTDTACYCPDAKFVQNVFTCLYAYGETDEIISEAVTYFQGICGGFIPTNPGIATGADSITSVLTATATTAPSAVYTTVIVDVTTVVPCTTEGGATIPSSSSTITISTQVTVPQVGFTTISGGASASSVAVVPGTYSAVIPTATATGTGAGAVPPYPTGASTLVTAKPSGTGALKPSSTTGTAFATAGAAQVGAGLGFFGFAAIAVAAF